MTRLCCTGTNPTTMPVHPKNPLATGMPNTYFEQFISMIADKGEERNRYKKDLILAFKYLISYHKLVTKDTTARQE
jgi:hypothetical protein